MGQGVGYIVTVSGRTICHAGDTDLIPEMARLGHIDIASFPIGSTYTMGITKAKKAASVFHPDVVVPIHHLKADPEHYREIVEAASSCRVRVLGMGQIIRH